MAPTARTIKPPSADYDDDVLYGSRREALKLRNIIKSSHNSECLIYAYGTFVSKTSWNLNHIFATDKRVKDMLDGLDIKHALPLQRYCWPQLQQSSFPALFISPESSGKTTAHLLYIVSDCIKSTSISKTDRIMQATDDADPAQDNFSLEKDPQATKLKSDAPVIVDQDNFDFDSLGKEVNSIDKSAPEAIQAEPSLELEEFQNINPDDYIVHPLYVIICSSHQQVEKIDQDIERMKLAAFNLSYGFARLLNLPPTVSTIHVHQSEQKLAAKCSQCQVLITSPAALLKCLRLGYIELQKCKKVIFDDLDLTLQLHNSKIREIIKYYIIQTQADESDGQTTQLSDQCQVYMFSRKWTDLVRQFSSTVFLQRILIFGSLSEASLFANVRYEVEVMEDNKLKLHKLTYLINLFYRSGQSNGKLAVVFSSDQEARAVFENVEAKGYDVTLLLEHDAVTTYKASSYNRKTTIAKPVYFLSDIALDFILDHLTDVTHLVHFSLPRDRLIFDQRFRLLYKYINEPAKNIITSIFLNTKTDKKHAKELHDLLSRSASTLTSTKLTLRDYVETCSKTLCWRWATIGVCRLEKLSREDRLGSFCSERHSLRLDSTERGSDRQWPTGGQYLLTVTHVLSPNEIYFWFEAHRDLNSIGKKWNHLPFTGIEFMKDLQVKLDAFKDTPACSIPLKSFRKGLVCALYHPEESRVDRVVLLDVPELINFNQANTRKNGMMEYIFRLNTLEYSKQIEVIKIDYGIRITAYLRNLFFIPEDLAKIEPQAHRGFLLGIKPTDDEPNWIHKAKKLFYDQICINNLHQVTAWIRLSKNSCFWFENIFISRQLSTTVSQKIHSIDPHLELCQAGFAEKVLTMPSFLQPSERLRTISKWNNIQIEKQISFAYLRRDKTSLDIFILQVRSNLELVVRQVEFNLQLIELENELALEYQSNNLMPLVYVEEGIYCLARVKEGPDKYTINRCIVKRYDSSGSLNDQEEIDSPQERVLVYCLDHGDPCEVAISDLFQVQIQHIIRLPFQAIVCKIAELDTDILENMQVKNKLIDLIYDFSRDEANQLIALKCTLGSDKEVYLYRKISSGAYEPLIALFESRLNITLSKSCSSKLRDVVEFEEIVISNPIEDAIFASIMGSILMDLIKREMSAFGLRDEEEV